MREALTSTSNQQRRRRANKKKCEVRRSEQRVVDFSKKTLSEAGGCAIGSSPLYDKQLHNHDKTDDRDIHDVCAHPPSLRACVP
jgi:hypothetical protein